MPYDVNNPPRPAKNWSRPARSLCARVANGVLKGGGTDQQAVYACIRAVKARYPSTIKAPKSTWRKADELAYQEAAREFFEDKTEEELEQIFEPLLPDLIEFAPWKSSTKTNLPDSAYAIVYQPKGGGAKIRALPHHTSSGALDLSHLRNALARWNQVKGVPDAIKQKGLHHLEAHAKSAGVGEHDKAASDFTAAFYDLDQIEFKETADGKFSSTLQVLPEGKFVHPWYGDLDFSAGVLRAFKRNFDKRVLGTDIMVDEGHNRGKALGWYTELHVGKRTIGDKEYTGLWGNIEWTELGKEYLDKKIYKYFSAEVGNWTSPSGDKVENVLLGGGLTNRPFFKQMPQVTLSEGEASDCFVIGVFGDEQWQFQESSSEGDGSFSSGYHEPDYEDDEDFDEGDLDMDELLAAINAAYQKDFVDQDSVLAFIAELARRDNGDRLRTTFTALGVEFADGEDPVSAVAKAFKAAKDANVTLDTRLQAVEKQLSDAEFEKAWGAQLREGKVVPTQKDAMQRLFSTDRALFDDLMKEQQPVVLLGERGYTGDSEPGSSDDNRFRDGTQDTKDEVSKYLTIAGGTTANNSPRARRSPRRGGE